MKKPHQSGVRRLDRGAYHVTSNTGKMVKYRAQQKNPQQEKVHLTSPTRNGSSRQSQPLRNRHHSELLLSFSGLFFFQSSPSQLPPFLYKIMFFSLDRLTCLWLVIACMSPITSPLLFLNKPILLVK